MVKVSGEQSFVHTCPRGGEEKRVGGRTKRDSSCLADVQSECESWNYLKDCLVKISIV